MNCCNYNFDDFATYSYHVNRAHFNMTNKNKTNWKCTVCGYYLDRFSALDDHFRNEHENLFYLNSIRPLAVDSFNILISDSNLFEVEEEIRDNSDFDLFENQNNNMITDNDIHLISSSTVLPVLDFKLEYKIEVQHLNQLINAPL